MKRTAVVGFIVGVFALAGALVFVGCESGGPTGPTSKFIVRDINDMPVVNADVFIDAVSSDAVGSTDEEGEIIEPLNVPPGTYTARIVNDETEVTVDIIVEDDGDVDPVNDEDSMSEDSVSEDCVSEDSVSEDSMSEDSESEDCVSEDSVSEDSVSEDSVSEDSVNEP